ncbi:MAG: hypothetical protein JWN00_2469 [Actinomycetia bacterium]|nr:hypothetical protein [Actinomycetes bacterium]
MVVNLWRTRRRSAESAPEAAPAQERRRLLPQRRPAASSPPPVVVAPSQPPSPPAGPVPQQAGRRPFRHRVLNNGKVIEAEEHTVLVPRSQARGWQRQNTPIGSAVWAVALAAVAVLALAALLTWSDANQANGIVHAVVTTGNWLASPFKGIFTGSNAKNVSYATWALAGVVYVALGRILAWLIRW